MSFSIISWTLLREPNLNDIEDDNVDDGNYDIDSIDDHDDDGSDDDDDNQVELAEDKKQIKQDELTATLIAIKKYLRFAAICLFLIAVILIFK